MAGCTILIRYTDVPHGSQSVTRIETLANVAEAKEIAEARAAAIRQTGRKISVKVITPHGTAHAMVPRQGNTGPGRWIWKADRER